MFLTACSPRSSKTHIQRRAHMFLHIAGDTDSAGLGEAFHARGHIDAVAVEIVALDDHIAQADADAQHHAVPVGGIRVPLGEGALYVHRTLHRIHRAAEFGQRPIAGGLEDPSAELLDFGIEDLRPQGLQPGQRAGFIARHHARVADHISRQYRRQPSLNPFFGHGYSARPALLRPSKDEFF